MIFLRPVGYDDGELFKQSSYSTMPLSAIRQMIAESISKDHNGNYFELFAIMNGGNCVGFISLYGLSDTKISCGPEIKPQYRKQGFAYTAVKCGLKYARELGYTQAAAQVRQDNQASIALHKKLGFILCGESVNKKGHCVFEFEKSL